MFVISFFVVIILLLKITRKNEILNCKRCSLEVKGNTRMMVGQESELRINANVLSNTNEVN